MTPTEIMLRIEAFVANTQESADRTNASLTLYSFIEGNCQHWRSSITNPKCVLCDHEVYSWEQNNIQVANEDNFGEAEL